MSRIILTDADPETLSIAERCRRDLDVAMDEMRAKLAEDVFVKQPAMDRVMRLRDSMGVPTKIEGPTFLESPVSWTGFDYTKKPNE